MSKTLERLRAQTLAKKGVFKSETVTISADDGGGDLVFKVKTPSIGERGRIRQKSFKIRFDGAEDERVQFDILAMTVQGVVELTYDTEGNKVYNDNDIPELLKHPAGGWFDDLSEAVQKLMNPDKDSAKNDSGKTKTSS